MSARRDAAFVHALLTLALAAPVQAHTESGLGGGFVSGFQHPFQGGDHLLAMVAVGIWGAVLGAPLMWLLPVAFPLMMVAGAVGALAGVSIPGVEAGIAASVMVLGAVIAAFWRAPLALALAIVGSFGFLHGYAHGAELPAAAVPAAYASGFVLASGLLHATGIGLGTARALPRGPLVLRSMGAAMTLAGTWMVLGRPGAA